MFAWNESFAIGVPEIDGQHKQLFAIINDLQQAMMNRQSNVITAQTLDKLAQYASRHFSAEEVLMRSKNYSGLAQHQAIHDEFTAHQEIPAGAQERLAHSKH